MGEIDDNIIRNNSKTFARNTPLALVVGAGGFLGSHLTDALLLHNIQVVGVDNFSTGRRENLLDAIKNSSFHLINLPISEFSLALPRLDYIFFTAEGLGYIQNILELAKISKSKIVLLSSINLYDKKEAYGLTWLSDLENQIAKFAKECNLNARVVRLASVFGPRMHFREKDPIVRLIQASLLDELQAQSTALEFSSRAIFIDDAVKLIIKSMLAGATAQKIFDGLALQPTQVEEIKQVLLDPIWYEQKGFRPSELPPWPTPNLKSTMDHLGWSPRTSLVEALRKTISYFKDNQIQIPKLDRGVSFNKIENQLSKISNQVNKEEGFQKTKPSLKIAFQKNQIFAAIGWVLIFYALIFPIFTLGVGAISFRYNLDLMLKDLRVGEYDKSLQDVEQASKAVSLAKDWLSGIAILRKTDVLKSQLEEVDEILSNSSQLTSSLNHLILATKLLNQGFKLVATDSKDSPKSFFQHSALEFELASTGFSKVSLALKEANFKNIPSLQQRVDDLRVKIAHFEGLSKDGRVVALVLDKALDNKKTYLLVLQNNLNLRGAGGKIVSLAQIDFEDSKLKKVAVQDVSELDALIKEKIEPPKEIKEDLGKTVWLLSDSNWEPDFKTASSQINFFFKQITGISVDGVLAVDLDAFKEMLVSMGAVDLEGFGKIDNDNIMEKAVVNNPKFLIGLQKELLNRVFFGSSGVLPKTGENLISLFRQKHAMVAFFDPKLENLINSSNFSSSLSGKPDISGDFLAEIESSIGDSQVNSEISRKFKLVVSVDDKGAIFDKLSLSIINNSLKDIYKARVRIYLPSGTKLNKISLGEIDYKNKTSTFSDYGKVGYSFVISLERGEQKTLILDYQIPNKFENHYKLFVYKQAGTRDDKFELEFQSEKMNKKISSDLSEDRQFSF